MIKLLKWFKKKCPFLWRFIEYSNGLIVQIFYEKQIRKAIGSVLEKQPPSEYTYREVRRQDIPQLMSLFSAQPDDFYAFFRPHDFDRKTLIRLQGNSAFSMFGVFDREKIVGYFFIRFFFNRKAFRGKMVDIDYQGKGIAKQMGRITTDIAWCAGFRLFATVSRSNLSSIASSKAVNYIRVVKSLPDDYLYVEYTKAETESC